MTWPSRLDRVVVVGASLAGATAAWTLRNEGYRGELSVVGAEPHRPYDRPPLSKRYLAGKLDADALVLAVSSQLDEAGVDWRLGTRAAGLDLGDRAIRLEDGTSLPFDGAVLATGSSPRTLPAQPALAGLHVLRTRDQADALVADLDREPGRVAVVGAGFIGLEVASTCRERGAAVTVLEAADVPLGHALGSEMGDAVAAVHRDHDVELRLGVSVDGFIDDGAGRVAGVRLGDGTRVDADVVVVGIGVRPEVGWLEGSGLELDDGVVCDHRCEAVPGVLAVGDLARWPNATFDDRMMRVEHWDNAVEMGGYAARRLLARDGDVEPYAPVPWFWSDQYDRKIQLAGWAAGHDTVEVVAGSVAERRFAALYGRRGRVVAVLGMNRPRQVIMGRGLVAKQASLDEARAALAA